MDAAVRAVSVVVYDGTRADCDAVEPVRVGAEARVWLEVAGVMADCERSVSPSTKQKWPSFCRRATSIP